MPALNGQVYQGPDYDAVGVVVKKYSPRYQQVNFIVSLENGVQLWVHEAHYHKFEALDTIGCFGRMRGTKLWVEELVLLAKAEVPIVEREVELEYVSDPRKIGEDYWYLAPLEDIWYKIPYSVAKRYWLGDQSAPRKEMRGNYYELLGVPHNFTLEDLRRRWLAAVRRNHPDLFPEEARQEQGQITARLNAAYDCLSDVDERERYDRQLAEDSGQRVEGEVIRAWPGRGFGTLVARVEERGESCLVREILSWANREVEFEGSVPMGEVDIGRRGIVLNVPIGDSMYEQTEKVVVLWEHLPSQAAQWGRSGQTGFVNVGRLRYHIKGIRSGYWDWRNSRLVKTVRVREAELEWPPGFWERRSHLADAINYVTGR